MQALDCIPRFSQEFMENQPRRHEIDVCEPKLECKPSASPVQAKVEQLQADLLNAQSFLCEQDVTNRMLQASPLLLITFEVQC